MNSIQKSEAIKSSLRKGFQNGSSKMAKRKCYGYTINSDGELEINPDEAKVVNWIFERYLAGDSLGKIAAGLERQGIPSPTGRPRWNREAIDKLLSNEKYIGDALAQKTYTTSVFPYERRVNKGDVDQYYTENSHPAIISRDTFERAQALMKRRAQRVAYAPKEYPLSRKIICGDCGTPFIRRKSPSGYVSWVCRKHDDRAADCPVGRIAETEIYTAFLRMYNKLKHHEDIILKPVLAQLRDLNDALQKGNPAMLEVNRAIAETSEQIHKVAILRAGGLLDDDACTAKLRDIEAKLAELRRERRQLLKNEDIEEVIEALHQTAGIIHSGPDRLEEFDEAMFADLVEKITAESMTRIRFRLYGGMELTEQLREVRQ